MKESGCGVLDAAEFAVSMPDTSEAGTVPVTVTYVTEDGMTLEATFDITVYDRDTMEPQSIKVVKPPEQTVYGTGEAFQPEWHGSAPSHESHGEQCGTGGGQNSG